MSLAAPDAAADHLVPAVSDSGAVVAYVARPLPDDAPEDELSDDAPADERAEEPDSRVVIRDRLGDTTRPVAELASTAPGISGDGCVVAYVVRGAGPDASLALTAVDRCAADRDAPLPLGRVIDTVIVADDVVADPALVDVAAPAVSADGSTIVWSTGDEVRRYVRGAEPDAEHELVDAFDADPTPTLEVRTGPRVDVSADGRTVVFVAGAGADPYRPDVGGVYLWQRPDEEPGTVRPVSVTETGEPGVAASDSPTISGDGSRVAFESTSTDLAAVGDDAVAAPFVVLVDRAADTMQVVAQDARRPVLSADGTRLIHQRGAALRALSFGPNGAVDDEELLAAADPVGWPTTSRHGRFVVVASDAELTGAGGPGTDVWALDTRPGDAPTDVTTTTTTTTSTTTTTTLPGTTPTTTPATTPATTTATPPISPPSLPPSGPPPVVSFPPPPFPPRPFPPAPPGFPRSSPTPERAASFPGVDGPGDFAGATATPVRFDDTVVDAGRDVATSSLTVAQPTSVVSVDTGSSVFLLLADDCSGRPLTPGATCAVDVAFRPDTVGPASGLLTFQLSDGSVVTAPLEGVGAPAPTLEPVPAVATEGQVVTVFGVGFPPSSPIELRSGNLVDELVTDAAGGFAHRIVVMDRTAAGPMPLVVDERVDVHAEVVAELLVTSRDTGSGSAPFRNRSVVGHAR